MPVPIPPTTPGAPPTAPQRSEPSTYSARMDAWLLWFNASFWTWLFDLVPWIQARANDTESWANQASQSATTAGLTANASMWNPSTNYALGQNAISPTNFQTYRRRVAGVSATDPVSDATNWAAVAAVPDESVTTAKLAANAVTPAKLANGGRELGFRNRIINGDMRIVQRAISATVTAGTAVPTASTGYPAVDRFFVYSTGANVTAARVAAAQYRMQITGASGVTAIGVGQRIELLNCYDLVGGNATLSVDLANSLLTTVTWTASAAVTGDGFGTIGTPTKTQIATGTFTVNSTVTNYTATFAVPTAAASGIEILLTVGAQTSGTWTIGNMQLEPGSVATPFERRDIGRELIMCQRYYEDGVKVRHAISNAISGQSVGATAAYKVTKRATPIAVNFSSANGGATAGGIVFLDTNFCTFEAICSPSGAVFLNMSAAISSEL